MAWVAKWSRSKTNENLGQLATRLGLVLQPAVGWTKAARVTGTLHGKPVEIFTYATGSGKSRVTWSAVNARPAATGGLTFTLNKRGLGTKLTELLGKQSIKTGEKAFDDAWHIASNQPEFFGAALLPEFCAKLAAARLVGRRGAFELKAGMVQYAETGSFLDPKRTARFDALADIVCDLADIAEVAAARAHTA